jgi:hypothetical protein
MSRSTRVDVPRWGPGSRITLTARATWEQGGLGPGEFPLELAKPVSLLVPVGRKSLLTLALNADVEAPGSPGGTPVKTSMFATSAFPIQCTPEGDLVSRRRGRVAVEWDRPFDLVVAVYTWQDGQLGWPVGSVPAPPELRVLHVVTLAWLDRRASPGHLSVTVFNGQANDVPRGVVAGATGSRTAVLGPLVVELVRVSPRVSSRLSPAPARSPEPERARERCYTGPAPRR